MKNLDQMNAKNIIGVFFDIDDTFSSDGKISWEAYRSIWQLKEAGKLVVPITGRPAGWCDHIARMWPVDAVVGENGAFYFMIKNKRFIKKYTADPSQIEEYKKRLDAIEFEVLEAVPSAGVASDQNYREFDLAIDFCEDVKRLSQDDIDKIVQIFDNHGLNTKVSSIHVNAWFGEYDKLTTAKKFALNEHGIDLNKDNAGFVFCGDSPNDEPMFSFFDNSVGVANVMDFKDKLKSLPKYITPSRSGKGFVELVNHLLK